MRSGTVYGTAAMIDGMVARFQQELGQPAKVVITGGLGAAIAKYCTVDAVVDRDLLLDGLRIVYQKIRNKNGAQGDLCAFYMKLHTIYWKKEPKGGALWLYFVHFGHFVRCRIIRH